MRLFLWYTFAGFLDFLSLGVYWSLWVSIAGDMPGLQQEDFYSLCTKPCKQVKHEESQTCQTRDANPRRRGLAVDNRVATLVTNTNSSELTSRIL